MSEAWEARCSECDEPVEPNHVWLEVTGWEKRRFSGGTNHVALRELTGRHMCNSCMSKARAGLSTAQQDLGL